MSKAVFVGAPHRVAVPPLKFTRFTVGPFPADRPHPQLDVEVTTGEHRYLSYFLDWHDRPDGAHAIFFFENYGNTTCLVSIRRRKADAVNSTASQQGAKLA